MSGYYFVITEYASGRCGYSDKRYTEEKQAERRAAKQRKLANVISARVCYQTGTEPVDIKNYI